jgi:hypothetical protein
MATLAVGVVLSGSPFACSSSAPLAAAGGACTLVTDCEDGLVCCNGANGSLTCVASTGCLQPAGGGADAGNPATGAGQGDGAGGDSATGNPPGSDASQQVDDSGTPPERPDTGTTKGPVDSGKPEDTGTPPQEAAPPPPDSGGGDAPVGD